MGTAKRITKATFKSLVNKNRDNLYIRNFSSFDGMTDCVESCSGDWRKAEAAEISHENTLGINGIWLVHGSRNFFDAYTDDEGYEGIQVSKGCGNFVVALKK